MWDHQAIKFGLYLTVFTMVAMFGLFMLAFIDGYNKTASSTEKNLRMLAATVILFSGFYYAAT